MHVIDVPFFRSISHDVYCSTVGEVDNLKCPSLDHEIQKVIRSYSVRGFSIVLIAVDIEFKSLKDRNQAGMKFNVVSKEEHAPTIDIYHRVIEERFHLCCAMFPFKS